MQVKELHPEIDRLQARHGSPRLSAVYGTGCIKNPKVAFVFMNPTGKNVSSNPHWQGIRAPWLGTKNIWNLLYALGLLSKSRLTLTQTLRAEEWTEEIAEGIYGELVKKKVYITNLAKCTQDDARHLGDKVFRDYLENTKKELFLVRPKRIVLFGNQVSSILLERPITVSSYKEERAEILELEGKLFKTYPVYYPVGQGRRNLPLALKRLKTILEL